MSKKNNLADSGLKKLCSFLVLAASQGQLINDTLQAQDKVFSSKHVTDLINSMSEQDKKYVDDIVANLNKLSSKTTSVIPDSSNAEPNTLYLYSADPNPTSYNQYMVLSDKTILNLGNTNMSLDGYLKEIDADGKYLKQVDAHTHSNKSTIDNLTQNVIDNINNLNIEVDGVSYTQDVDGKIALPNYPTVPDIATSINASSVDTDTVSPKAVYDNAIKDKNLKTYTYLEQIGLRKPTTVGDIFNALPILSSINIQVDNFSITDAPYGNGILMIDKYINSKFSILFKISGAGSVADNGLYIGQLKGSDGTGLTWKRVCSTSVADVTQTVITSLDSETNYAINGTTNTSRYYVKDGVCEITLFIKAISPSSSNHVSVLSGLPPSIMSRYFTLSSWGSATSDSMVAEITAEGTLNLKMGTTNGVYIGSFSYRVKES